MTSSCSSCRPTDSTVAALAQGFADVATIGILQQRAHRHESDLSDQLQYALNSRVTIEQAKGVVAGQLGIDTDEAFMLIRTYARSHSRLLVDVASDVTGYRLLAATLQSEQDVTGTRRAHRGPDF